MFKNVTIVGVGLISGSFALGLKEKGLATHIIGVSRTEASSKRAMELGLIDEIGTAFEAEAKLIELMRKKYADRIISGEVEYLYV